MWVPTNSQGSLNGTSSVALVAAPGAGQRHELISIAVYNADSAAVTITFRFSKAGTDRIIDKKALAVGETWTWSVPLILDATDETLTMIMSGAAATTNPYYMSNYGVSYEIIS